MIYDVWYGLMAIDIILECYERKPEKAQLPAFLGLISQFNRTSVCQLLGFKFKQYQTNATTAATPTPTPAAAAANDTNHGTYIVTWYYCQWCTDGDGGYILTIAPSSLFDVAAALIQAEVVGLAQLYPHVTHHHTPCIMHHASFIIHHAF